MKRFMLAAALVFPSKDLYSWVIGGSIGAAIGNELSISKTGVLFRFKKDF